MLIEKLTWRTKNNYARSALNGSKNSFWRGLVKVQTSNAIQIHIIFIVIQNNRMKLWFILGRKQKPAG